MMKIARIKKVILPILKKNEVTRAGIFGSYARGSAKKGSNVDILVKIGKKKTLLDISFLQLSLERELHKKVDLVEYQEIHPSLRKMILKEEIRIL